MITYSFHQAVPRMQGDAMIALLVGLTATDDATGQSASLSNLKLFDVPVVFVAAPSQADILALCEEVAAEFDMHAAVDAQLASAVFVPFAALKGRGNERDAFAAPPPAPPAPALAEVKKSLSSQVDFHIAGITTQFTKFSEEYKEREAAARAYREAGYTGALDAWVADFAVAAGMTEKAAADLVISQADKLRGALKQLGGLRMRKYVIARAASEQAARDEYAAIISAANTIAAML